MDSGKYTFNNVDAVSRLNYEYQQKVKNYTPYEAANVQIINYSEIRIKTLSKKTNETSFEVVSQRTKVKPVDVLVLMYNDKTKFFSSIDNLATGFTEEASYRDTLFFDHLNKVAFIARRKVIPCQTQPQPVLNTESTRTSEHPNTGAGYFNQNVVESVQKYCDFKLNSIKNVVDEIGQIEQKQPKKKSRSKKEILSIENKQEPKNTNSSVNFEPRTN